MLLMALKQGSPGLKAQPILFLPIPGQIAPGREGKLVRTLAPWKSPQNRATQEQSPGDACWEDGCRWTGSERVTGCTCPSAPPELATCPEQPVARVGRRESFPMASSPSPLLGVRAKGWPQAAGGGHDVTSRWQRARWTPTPTHRSPPGRLALSLPANARPGDFLFLCGAEVSQRGGGPRVTARHAAWGGGRGADTAAGPGAAGRQRPAPCRCTPGPRPPATQAPQHPSQSPGLASRPAPTRGRTHPGPAPIRAGTHLGRCLPGAHPPRPASSLAPHPRGPATTLGAPARPAPTRGAAVGASRVPRSLQQLQDGPSPLLGHGRDAARPRCRARARSVHPAALGPHAGCSPPAALRHPGRPQPARRFRIPAAGPGSAAAAAGASAAAAERVPARGPGRTARSGRHGPRAAPSGAGGRAASFRAQPGPQPARLGTSPEVSLLPTPI